MWDAQQAGMLRVEPTMGDYFLSWVRQSEAAVRAILGSGGAYTARAGKQLQSYGSSEGTQAHSNPTSNLFFFYWYTVGQIDTGRHKS